MVSPLFIFFSNDPATTEIYTLSLHDALPISRRRSAARIARAARDRPGAPERWRISRARSRRKIGRAHSELQSPMYLVCRLLLEKKKNKEQQLARRVVLAQECRQERCAA